MSYHFLCFNCNFKCMKKGDFNRHLNTEKHILLNTNQNLNQDLNVNQELNTNICETDEYAKLSYPCNTCNKIYKSRTGLWTHKKKCILVQKESNKIEPSEKQLIMMLIKENTEMKNMMMDVCKNIQPNITNTNSTINSNNKFNLQFFLNTTCKDALNLTEFINSLTLQLTDLENVGSSGYVNGLSNIIIKNLNALEITKRPVHCSDIKREVMYVKEENTWQKEKEEKEKLTKAIQKIALKNMKQLPDWQKKHPGYEKSDNIINDKFLKIVNESAGASTDRENEEYIHKIIKNVAKEVIIEKEF